MRKQASLSASGLPPVVALVALPALALASVSCQVILGSFDFNGKSAGAGGTTSSNSTSGSSATSSVSSSSGTGGSGMQPSFTFAVTDASVDVPQGGLDFVNVAITPSGGFSAPVQVTVTGPTGATGKPLTIPAGSTTGKLEVGADMTLMIGMSITLTLQATSGSLSKTATVQGVVTGAPGTLDMSFAAAGIFVGPKGGGNGGDASLLDVHEVAQNKILAAGWTSNSLGGGAAIGVRLLHDGTADSGFGTSGVVTHSFGSAHPGSAAAGLRELDGTVVLAGSGYSGTSLANDIFILRYQDNGTVDGVGGDQGVEDVPLSGLAEVTAAGIAPNSTSIVVTGTKDNALFLARIQETLAGGYPDQTFAAPNGWLTPLPGSMTSGASTLTFDAMSRILVSGAVTNASTGLDLVLLRLSSDGALDSTFGSGGILTVPRMGDQVGGTVIVQPDGNILVAAISDEGSASQTLVQRFLPSGMPDTTFGTQGAVLSPLGGSLMVLMNDGRIVLGGNGVQGTTSGPLFTRLLPNGAPDPTFGSGGPVVVYVGDSGTMQAMALASDGKLLIAGSFGSGPSTTFVARVWN